MQPPYSTLEATPPPEYHPPQQDPPHSTLNATLPPEYHPQQIQQTIAIGSVPLIPNTVMTMPAANELQYFWISFACILGSCVCIVISIILKRQPFMIFSGFNTLFLFIYMFLRIPKQIELDSTCVTIVSRFKFLVRYEEITQVEVLDQVGFCYWPGCICPKGIIWSTFSFSLQRSIDFIQSKRSAGIYQYASANTPSQSYRRELVLPKNQFIPCCSYLNKI